ncbi:hypothetical protein [Limnohabitans sp.]|uniref:hypothetical protein n=1 Tax=Limnohabitans sp. TaxID=1907725 RepID=UPI0037C0C62A
MGTNESKVVNNVKSSTFLNNGYCSTNACFNSFSEADEAVGALSFFIQAVPSKWVEFLITKSTTFNTNMASESLNVKSIALRYWSVEDRLTVVVSLQDGSNRKLWLTRQLTRSLIDAVGNLLDKSYQEVPLAGSEQKIDKTLGLQFEQQEANEIKAQTPSQPANSANESQEPRDDGLCTTIDLAKTGDFKWRLGWKAALGPAYPMQLTRIEMHQLLQLLVRLQSQQKWDIQIAYPWINTEV